MSGLVGAIQDNNGPIIDKRLGNKLVLLTTIPITDDIKRLLIMGFWGVAEQLEKINY